MKVKCISFGSVWRYRAGHDGLLAHSCVFNTTGFGPRDRRAYMTEGEVRFNCNVKPPIQSPAHDLLGTVYECKEGVRLVGKINRLFLHPRLPDLTEPDFYLVRVASEMHGRIHYKGEWRTNSVSVIAASSHGDRQEFLLLMGPNARIVTTLGVLDLTCLMKHQQ